MTQKRKVFFSFHEKDSEARDRLVKVLGDKIIDKSVHQDDIKDFNLKTETVQQRIRDEHVAGSEVTVVLIGRCTWKRKHVDREIHSSLRDTPSNPRNGVIGILLKSHFNYDQTSVESRLIPPRVADNLHGPNPYARIYKWPKKTLTKKFLRWIEEALERRSIDPSTRKRTLFSENQKGRCSQGWQPERGYPRRLPFAE